MGKRKFVHVDLPTADREVSRQFYTDVFGWDSSFMEEMDYMFFVGGNIGGGYVPLADGRKPGDVICYISSEDIEADLARIKKLGGSVVEGKTEVPGAGWWAVFKDPAGNELALWKTANPEGEAAAAEMLTGRKVVHVEIPAADRAKSAQFYQDLFGWEFEHMNAMQYTTFMADNDIGGGYPEVGEMYQPGDVVVYLGSGDLDADSQAIKANGGKVMGEPVEVPGFGTLLFFADPTGNRLALWKSSNNG